MTHAELVVVASRWLQKKCSVVVTEIATIGEEPDALGFQGTHSTLIECKASRADFLADRYKDFRREPGRGIGCRRYFLAPRGLISVDELPPMWGLLELDGEKVRCVRESEFFEPSNERHEIAILLSCLRRLGKTSLPGCSIRHYTIETRNRATLGVEALP